MRASLIALALCTSLHAQAAPPNDWSRDEFQYKTVVDGTGVYLYVPAGAKKIRAVLLLQQHVSEQVMSVHPAIRKACDASDTAIAWWRSGFNATFEQGAQESHAMIERELGKWGAAIGYPELGRAPLITYGHSTTVAYSQLAAESRPDRVLAVYVTHGGSRVDSLSAYKGPMMVFIGHYWEQGQQRRSVGMNKNMQSLGKVRKRLEKGWMPITVVEEYGSGHFDYGDEVMGIFGMYLEKAVKARLDADGKLRDVDPAAGYIATYPGSPSEPIPVKPYSEGSDAEKARSIWFFDKELAEATVKVVYGSGPWQREFQFVGYNKPDGTPAPFGGGGLVNPVPYEIVPGTNEIRMYPVLLDAYPAGFKEEGQKIGKSADPKITMEYVNGPYIHYDADGKLRVKPNRGTDAGYLVARHRGDAKFRPSVQPTYLRLGGGREAVALDNPGDQKCGAKVALKKQSTAATFVGYYVDHGPARVVGETLEILPIPANTAGPLEVELVAYSLGQTVTGTASVKFSVSR